MRILIIDDHQVLCVAFSEHLKRISPDICASNLDIVTAFTLEKGIEQLKNEEVTFDIVFLDLHLNDDNTGINTLEIFHAANENSIPTIIFTGMELQSQESSEILRRCIRDFGIRGILMKSTDIDTMSVGLKRIFSGEDWMPHEVLMLLASDTPKVESASTHYLNLTPREWEVARCLTRGLPDKEIARELKLSPHYIRQVTGQIYQKLDVRSRTEAAIRVSDFIKIQNYDE